MAGGSQGANPSQIAPSMPQGNAGIPPQQAAIGQAALQGYNPQAQMQQLQRPPVPPATPPMPPQGLPSIQGQTKPMVLEKPPLDEGQMQSIYESQQRGRGFADGGQIGMSNYASPNQNFMQYPQQGQPNQPPQTQSSVLPSTAFMGGPDSGADYAPANMGFDGSGSDGGVGGQPAPMQTPLGATSAGMNSGLPQAQGNKPLGLAQFQQPQGLQIAGNPTSQIVQRPQQR